MTQLVIPSHGILVLPPPGTGTLPLVELDKVKVQTDGKHIQLREGSKKRRNAFCSYGDSVASLQFTAWELFHAVKKTELTRTFTPQRAGRLGLLFADEHHDRFVWNTANLRCTDGSGLWLEDFSGTNLSGRIGEALAYLTMVQPTWGYVYWDRIASVWMRAASNAHIQHQDMLQVVHYTGQITANNPNPQPDFAFEKQDHTVALMEAKGSFVTPGNCQPDVKGPLKHGLEQLDKWGPLIAPAPARSIAIGSFLREQSDACTDPSVILHVDPLAGRHPDIEPVNVPRDMIRRGNFGAWLAEMGFRSSGRALAERRATETSLVELGVVSLGGRDYAFSIQGWRVDPTQFAIPPWFSLAFMLAPRLHHLPWRHLGVTGVYALGLEIGVLHAVSASLMKVEADALMELEPQLVETGRQQAPDGFYGSVMPDGSMIGIISTRLLEPEMRVESFRL